MKQFLFVTTVALAAGVAVPVATRAQKFEDFKPGGKGTKKGFEDFKPGGPVAADGKKSDSSQRRSGRVYVIFYNTDIVNGKWEYKDFPVAGAADALMRQFTQTDTSTNATKTKAVRREIDAATWNDPVQKDDWLRKEEKYLAAYRQAQLIRIGSVENAQLLKIASVEAKPFVKIDPKLSPMTKESSTESGKLVMDEKAKKQGSSIVDLNGTVWRTSADEYRFSDTSVRGVFLATGLDSLRGDYTQAGNAFEITRPNDRSVYRGVITSEDEMELTFDDGFGNRSQITLQRKRP